MPSSVPRREFTRPVPPLVIPTARPSSREKDTSMRQRRVNSPPTTCWHGLRFKVRHHHHHQQQHHLVTPFPSSPPTCVLVRATITTPPLITTTLWPPWAYELCASDGAIRKPWPRTEFGGRTRIDNGPNEERWRRDNNNAYDELGSFVLFLELVDRSLLTN